MKPSRSSSAAAGRVFAAGRAGGFPQHPGWCSRAVRCSWLSPANQPQEVPTATPAAPATTIPCSRARRAPLPSLRITPTPRHSTILSPKVSHGAPGSPSILSCSRPGAPQLLFYRQLCCGCIEASFVVPGFDSRAEQRQGCLVFLPSGQKGSQG